MWQAATLSTLDFYKDSLMRCDWTKAEAQRRTRRSDR
jgi:hypothetical protein